jgi:hypothetical protein
VISLASATLEGGWLAGLQEINTEETVRLYLLSTMRDPEIWILQIIEPQGGVSKEMQVRKDVSGKIRCRWNGKPACVDAAGEAGRWQGLMV